MELKGAAALQEIIFSSFFAILPQKYKNHYKNKLPPDSATLRKSDIFVTDISVFHILVKSMKILLNALCCAMALCASIGVSASSYNYKCGPVSVEIEDLSSAYLNEFKLVISQNAKNTSEYSKQTLYPSTVELHLYPDEHSIAGTFSSKDNSIGEYSFVQYNSNFRFLNMQAESFFTIESRGGNSYAITGGRLEVRNNAGNTYTYNYCYAESDLNDRDAPVTPFEFTYTLSPLPSDDDDPEEPDITEFDTIYVSAVDYSSSYFPESHDWMVTMHDASESLYGIDIYARGSGLETGRIHIINGVKMLNEQY